MLADVIVSADARSDAPSDAGYGGRRGRENIVRPSAGRV
jgi:hypothetical protein